MLTVRRSASRRSAVKKVSAYVPQDDMLCPVLTVREALTEACIFKTKLGVAQREAKVSSLIQQFGLDVCKDVIIGSPTGKKGISGGQKRRVSVALELCGNPSLLYLDEPTSGLDVYSSLT
jgi:ABC-type multidrug transport system ATPase subunit